MKNILIIGSKGFIGSNLTKYFKSIDKNVSECDVLVDYNNPNYIQVDSTNSDYMDIFHKKEFDVCVNCSGAASVPDSFNHNYRDYTLNVYNLYKILNAIKKHQSNTKFINLSSAAVYGNPISLPIKEHHDINPISPYGFHKKYSEEICFEFYKFFNIQTVSLRIFSAYGEGLKKQLFWDLYKRSIQSNKMELFGNGKESRDFIHINDLAIAIDLIINKSKFQGDVINVANGQEIYIKDACDLFLKIIDWSGECTFIGNARTGDPSNWLADISKLKKMGYKCSVSLESGLKNYFKWIKNIQLE